MLVLLSGALFFAAFVDGASRSSLNVVVSTVVVAEICSSP